MRPLILLSSLATGGAESVTVAFARALAARNGEATLATVTDRQDEALARRLESSGVRRFHLRARRLADPFAFLRLLQLLRREPFDVVHAHGQDASILAQAATALTAVPFVLTRHVVEEPQSNRRQHLRAQLAWRAARRAARVVAVSQEVARALVVAGVEASRINVIRNGIELEPFSNFSSEGRLALRKALGVPPNDPVVLVPAVLRPGKGHRVLFDALPQLFYLSRGLRVWLVGSGELEPDIRSWAAQFGERVAVLGWRSDMPELMAGCDLVVLPSLSEALPTVLMEAAAAGRAVVATRVGGTPEIVEEGVTGELVAAGNAHALAEAVRSLLRDSERRLRLASAARARAVACFGIEHQLERTLALWRSLQRST